MSSDKQTSPLRRAKMQIANYIVDKFPKQQK